MVSVKCMMAILHSILNWRSMTYMQACAWLTYTGELGYDGLNGTREIGPSYAKSVVYIWRILDMHRTGTKHIVRHMQKSVVQWSIISKFTCNNCSAWCLFTYVLNVKLPLYWTQCDDDFCIIWFIWYWKQFNTLCMSLLSMCALFVLVCDVHALSLINIR